MSDVKVFSVEEVNAALKLAGSADRFSRLDAGWSLAYWWDLGERHRIAALALGVLPEGWRRTADSLTSYVYEGPDWYVAALDGSPHCGGQVASDNWPEAVRSGQAEVACRVLAAHVELERLRAKS